MDSVDLQVLRSAADWVKAGRRVVMATVIRTWGSAPRPIGALTAIRDDGMVVGSVSGGCIEDDMILQVRSGELVLEPLTKASGIDDLLARVERHELVKRQLDMKTGRATIVPALSNDQLVFDGATLSTVHGPRWRMLIIGAGQLSTFLAQMAQGLDYQVIICDPREEYADGWSIAGVEFKRGMPDDVVTELNPDGHTAVVTLTHDPKLDDMALLEALKSPAFYVGAIGSKKNNDARRRRLADFDLSQDEIARLHGPVGLKLGAKTPPEIAIAILAEMTAIRNGVKVPEMAEPGKATVAGCVT